jgi:two-component system, NarL family, response regulator NreC
LDILELFLCICHPKFFLEYFLHLFSIAAPKIPSAVLPGAPFSYRATRPMDAEAAATPGAVPEGPGAHFSKENWMRRTIMGIRIIIADDHKIMRQGLRSLLEKDPGIEVVAEADTGRQTISLVREFLPQVVIMDVEMPDLNGVDACRQILEEFPHIKIIALSMHADRRFVVNMLQAGAQGYLLKDCAFEELVQAIRLAMANRTYLSPGVAVVVVNDYSKPNTTPSLAESPDLTNREREILQLMSEGKRSSQIAGLLSISVKTVDTHRQQIMNKLGTRSVAELTKYAIREGLTSLDG